jgi:hypothetical protein
MSRFMLPCSAEHQDSIAERKVWKMPSTDSIKKMEEEMEMAMEIGDGDRRWRNPNLPGEGD